MNYLLKPLDNFEIFRSNFYSSYRGNPSLHLNQEPYLDIVLTDYCNRKCKFCIADLLEKKDISDTEIFKNQIAYAIQNFGVKEVLLVGGEPTLAKNLFDIISYLKTKEEIKKICLTTNGDRLVQDKDFSNKLFSSGITHLNFSYMNLDPAKQKYIGTTNNVISVDNIKDIREASIKYNIDFRINNNIFYDNNDTLDKLIDFYYTLTPYCDSIKFSPLLKVDSFSIVSNPKEWVNKNILSDNDYEALFKSVEEEFKDFPIVRNPLTFGFVEYSMICMPTPLILNYNHRGQMAAKASQGLVNNIKLLSNGNLSLSWNKDDTSKVIRNYDETKN